MVAYFESSLLSFFLNFFSMMKCCRLSPTVVRTGPLLAAFIRTPLERFEVKVRM